MILLSISRSLGACIVCLAAVVTAVTAEPTVSARSHNFLRVE